MDVEGKLKTVGESMDDLTKGATNFEHAMDATGKVKEMTAPWR